MTITDRKEKRHILGPRSGVIVLLQERNMKTHWRHSQLNLDELEVVAGGTSPIQVVMNAYNATLKEAAAAQKKD